MAAFPGTFGCLYGALLLLCVLLLQRLVQCEENKCAYNTKQLWIASLRESPLLATPTFFDVDGDGYGDVVAPSFSGEVWSIHGESGHIVDNWPFYLEERAFHSTPLIYDINRDGVVEFLLTTSDAEILFLHTNNSLLHGETIKIAPLKVRRSWYRLDRAYLEKIVSELNKQIGDSGRLKTDQLGIREERRPPTDGPPGVGGGGTKDLHQHGEAFSEFESRYGRHADPLYSRHQPDGFIRGLDPRDGETVFVDPHVLATPTLADMNGDGQINELVVPVSYYFDPYYYGDPHNLAKLRGLERDELVHFVAAAIVVIDLTTGAVIGQKVLGLTDATDSQPAYLLSTPTVVRLLPGVGGVVIVVGTATGEITMLEAGTLNELPGFPVRVDSVAAGVAVADLLDDGALELVVGDNSGNVYCIDSHGNRKWEFECGEPVQSDIRFADIDRDTSGLDVVFVTLHGTLWVLKGNSGQPLPGYPISLNTHTESSPLLMHLSHGVAMTTTAGDTVATAMPLTAVIPGLTEIYFVDLSSLCVHTVSSESTVLSVISGDVDPYSPGVEILSIGLDGKIICYSSPPPPSSAATARKIASNNEVAMESWSPDPIGHVRFTHQSDSVVVLLPWEHNTTVDLHGNSFTMEVTVLDNSAVRLKQITLSLSIGRKYLLYNDTLPLHHTITSHTITIPTPPVAMATFVMATACTEHLQCQSASRHVRFNLGYRYTLQWYLCGPFLALSIAFLWLLRDVDSDSLPMYGSSNRKSL